MIRGAIAFGLVLRLDNFIKEADADKKLSVIKSSAITLVVGTTLIFGSTMMPVQKWLLPALTEEQIFDQLVDKDTMIEDEQSQNLMEEMESRMNKDEELDGSKGGINKTKNLDEKKTSTSQDLANRGSVNHEDNDHYEEFLHPNMRLSVKEDKNAKRRESTNTRRKRFNSCKACFKRFDELIMKPFFIYRYDKELVSKKADFMDLFLQEAEHLEEAFVKEEFSPE
jgi:hypothetical protein